MDTSDATILATVKSLLSKEYPFELFLHDRSSGAKERIRQQIKNKKRYDAAKAKKEAEKNKAKESQKLEEFDFCVQGEK